MPTTLPLTPSVRPDIRSPGHDPHALLACGVVCTVRIFTHTRCNEGGNSLLTISAILKSKNFGIEGGGPQRLAVFHVPFLTLFSFPAHHTQGRDVDGRQCRRNPLVVFPLCPHRLLGVASDSAV